MENIKEKNKLDEDGYIIIAENVKVIFNAEIQPLSSVSFKDNE